MQQHARIQLAQAGSAECIQVPKLQVHVTRTVNTKVHRNGVRARPCARFPCLRKACIVQIHPTAGARQDAIFMHVSRALVKPAQRAQPFRESDDSFSAVEEKAVWNLALLDG
jgi:hypothetical protein